MKNLDLYKLIIYASIVLIPAAGFWVYWQTQQLEVAKSAVADATKQNGLLEKIGLLQKELETIQRSARTDNAAGNHRLYFERQILGSARDGQIGPNDLSIDEEAARPNRGARAMDYEVRIDFQRAGRPLPLSRSYLGAVLMNCEAQSKGVWKLRDLDIVNAEAGKANGKKPPPKTVNDIWEVRKLVFARREPEKR